MRRILLQLALFLVFGGWCATASAAWDLTNVVPINKPSGLKDGMYVYFRGQCNASSANMVLGADFSYANSDVNSKHIFKLVDAGKSVNGKQMFYMQNHDNKKWFSGTVSGWTIENMEESTPLAIAEASLFTFMEMKVPDDVETNKSFTVAEWVAAGGDEYLTDEEIFANSTKIEVWKWRPSQLNAENGDALVLATFADDFKMSDEMTGFKSISNVWGSAFGYTSAWFNEGKTAINPWYAYEATYVDDPIGDLESLIAIYKADNHQYIYRGGTDPGCVDAAIYDAFAEKYQEAINFVEGDPTEPGAATLYDELKARRDALDKAPRVALTEGYYYIASANWLFEEKQKFTITGEDGETVEVGKTKAMYDRANDAPAWADLYKQVTADGAEAVVAKKERAYIFRITKSEKDPAYWAIQNALTGRFMDGCDASNNAVKSVLLVDNPLEIQKVIAPNDGAYGIRRKGGGAQSYYHTQNHSNGAGTASTLTGWSIGTNGGSTWRFVAINDQLLIDSITAELKQQAFESALQNEINIAQTNVDKGYLPLLTSVDQLSANATQSSEGSLANLVDKNTATYYHSAYSGDAPEEDHYLQVALPEAVNKAAIYWYKRTQNSNNRPTKMTIMGLNSGGEWTEAATLPLEGDTLPWGTKTPEYKIELALAGGPYTALRLVVNETTSSAGVINAAMYKGHPFFTMSELGVFNGMDAEGNFIYRASSLAYRDDMRAPFETLSAALAVAKAKLGEATQEDIDAMKAANEAFEVIYPDTTILDAVITKAKAYYEEAIYSSGDENMLGAYNTPSVYEALDKTVTGAEAGYDKATVTRAYIDEQTAFIQQAIDAFVADINMPKMDTWYYIVSKYNGVDRPDNDPQGKLIYAGGKNKASGIKWGGDVSSNGESDATYVWRFLDMGNNTFAVQNLGTGYYMGANRGTSSQYLLSDTAVAFKFAYVAGEQLSLDDANYNPEQKTYRFIHADASNNIVTWSAAMDSPSSWTFEAVDFDNFQAQLKVAAGGMNIYTFPFATAAEGAISTIMGDEVKVYTIANVTADEEGMISQITLNPMDIPVGGIPAGTPFIIAHDDEDMDGEGNAIIDLSIDINAALTQYAISVNGLVGLLDKDTIKVDGMGYFAGDVQEIAKVKKNAVINAQLGYINPKLITNVAAVDGSIVIGIKDGGTLDNIQEAIKDANALVNVTDLSGVTIRRNVKKANALKGLSKGVYIVDGKKVSVK